MREQTRASDPKNDKVSMREPPIEVKCKRQPTEITRNNKRASGPDINKDKRSEQASGRTIESKRLEQVSQEATEEEQGQEVPTGKRPKEYKRKSMESWNRNGERPEE